MSERSNRRIERLAADCEKFKRQVASMRAEEDRFGDAVAELSRITATRPIAELTVADGEVLLWWWHAGELTCCGPTHYRRGHSNPRWYFTPLPKVRKPDGAR